MSAASTLGEQLREFALDAAWGARTTLLQFGLAGTVGTLLLIAAAWIMLVQVPRVDASLQAMQDDLATLQSEQAARPAAVVRQPPLEALREQLEPRARFASVVQDLNELLAKANVALVDATLGEPGFKDTRAIGRIEMAVYARGPYGALKSSVGDLLTKHPGLALEQVTLERNDANGAMLDAHFRFAYYFRS